MEPIPESRTQDVQLPEHAQWGQREMHPADVTIGLGLQAIPHLNRRVLVHLFEILKKRLVGQVVDLLTEIRH